MEFQPIESIAPYHDLVPAEDRASELERFVTEWLTPQLAQMDRLRAEAVHVGVMYNLGRLAMGINSQLSSWIPRAERYRKQRRKEIAEAVRERGRADVTATNPNAKSGNKGWSEAKVKESVDAEIALWDALIESLRMVRDDMSTTISFAQTTMRWMRSEEMSGNLEA
jgi:hypothetical protein